jgi:hypothetical protein
MLVSEPAVGRVIDDVKLRAEDFYLDRHRAIFGVMIDLYARGTACDELTVKTTSPSWRRASLLRATPATTPRSSTRMPFSGDCWRPASRSGPG